MGYSISQSLISSQPPLIVFTLCLTAFGFTMVVLAYVVGEKEIPNPDVKMDWNKYFTRVSNLRLCPSTNFSVHSEAETFLNSSHHAVVDESKSMSEVLSGVVDLAMDGTWDDHMFLDVSVSTKFGIRAMKLPSSPLHLRGQIKGYLLGFSGKYGRLLYNVSLTILPLQKKSNCSEREGCYSDYEVCISMSWPTHLLPKTNRGPAKCSVSESQNVLPIFFSESPLSKEEKKETSCMELNYTPDVKLTEMLSLHERSIVNLHLMHTSYFMFVMVMTLICYSLIRGRSYRHPKNYVSLQVLEA